MSRTESFGRTIQLFLVDGTPSGLRKATIHGWTGVVFVAGASAFGDLIKRAEVDRSGIYVLTGPDPAQSGQMRVYIGSANSVSERIRQSAEKRDFWETAIAVTTSDDDLSKGTAEYLEARLIERTVEAGRVELDNATQPDIARRRVPEADRANMEQFLSNLAVILPVIGIEMLKPQPRAARAVEIPVEQRTVSETRFEIRHRTGVRAEAVEEDGEFVVLEGAEALRDTTAIMKSYAALKQKLVDQGVIVADGNARFRFAKPYAFSSPSAAAAVVLDRNANGRLEWKVKNTGKTYQDWQEERFPEHNPGDKPC